ncbi:hypothetical protein C8R46DRAFT_1050730, partial [Mycena filopes]
MPEYTGSVFDGEWKDTLSKTFCFLASITYYESSAWCGKFEHPNDVRWEDKNSQLFEPQMGAANRTAGTEPPQVFAVKIGQNHSDIIDAKMTGAILHIIEEYRIGSKGGLREEVYRYKYVLDVDGNTFSGRYLGSGSLVFKATAFDGDNKITWRVAKGYTGGSAFGLCCKAINQLLSKGPPIKGIIYGG